MSKRRGLLAVLLSGAIFTTAIAQESDLGEISFPTSGSETAQEHFIRGVLLLHSFEYADARAAFQEAQSVDSGFAMAFWGEAMTHNHPIWNQQNASAGRSALEKLAATPVGRLAKAPTAREKDYLRTLDVLFGEGDKESRDLAYMQAMQELSAAYPDDAEARGFYALSILGTAQGKRDFRIYMKAGAIALDVFHGNPRHPGAAHYVIHSFDDPIHAPLGLPAAHVYADIAPDAPHALHMPSHIFMALGMWDESASSNEASYTAAVEKGQSGHHATWWLHYSYLQQGRYAEARKILDRIEDQMESDPGGHTRRHVAYMRSSYLIETRQWDSELVSKPIDLAGLPPQAAASILFARGMAAIEKNELKPAKGVLSEIAPLTTESGASTDDLQLAALIHKQLLAMISLKEGNPGKAVAEIEAAAELQESMRYEFGPPVPVKPIHETHGEILLELGRADEAVVAFQRSLDRDPLRQLSLLGQARAYRAAGKTEASRKAYASLRRVWHRADRDLPDLTETRVAVETGGQ